LYGEGIWRFRLLDWKVRKGIKNQAGNLHSATTTTEDDVNNNNNNNNNNGN
jgi:hypothetical protein